jgi:hypothetical protein
MVLYMIAFSNYQEVSCIGWIISAQDFFGREIVRKNID